MFAAPVPTLKARPPQEVAVAPPYAATPTQMALWEGMQQQHRGALSSVTAAVDKEEPDTFANVSLRKAQQRSRNFIQGMAQEKIGEGNRKLIRQMQEIVHRPGEVSKMISGANEGHGAFMCAHSHDFYRKARVQQRQLQAENQALVKRLLAASSTVNHRAHERDYEKHRNDVQRMKKVSGWHSSSCSAPRLRRHDRLPKLHPSSSAPTLAAPGEEGGAPHKVKPSNRVVLSPLPPAAAAKARVPVVGGYPAEQTGGQSDGRTPATRVHEPGLEVGGASSNRRRRREASGRRGSRSKWTTWGHLQVTDLVFRESEIESRQPSQDLPSVHEEEPEQVSAEAVAEVLQLSAAAAPEEPPAKWFTMFRKVEEPPPMLPPPASSALVEDLEVDDLQDDPQATEPAPVDRSAARKEAPAAREEALAAASPTAAERDRRQAPAVESEPASPAEAEPALAQEEAPSDEPSPAAEQAAAAEAAKSPASPSRMSELSQLPLSQWSAAVAAQEQQRKEEAEAAEDERRDVVAAVAPDDPQASAESPSAATVAEDPEPDRPAPAAAAGPASPCGPAAAAEAQQTQASEPAELAQAERAAEARRSRAAEANSEAQPDSPAVPLPTALMAQPTSVLGYMVEDAVLVYSSSKGEWLPGTVKGVYPDDTNADGFSIRANTIKVVSSAGKKYILEESIPTTVRKDTTASSPPEEDGEEPTPAEPEQLAPSPQAQSAEPPLQEEAATADEAAPEPPRVDDEAAAAAAAAPKPSLAAGEADDAEAEADEAAAARGSLAADEAEGEAPQAAEGEGEAKSPAGDAPPPLFKRYEAPQAPQADEAEAEGAPPARTVSEHEELVVEALDALETQQPFGHHPASPARGGEEGPAEPAAAEQVAATSAEPAADASEEAAAEASEEPAAARQASLPESAVAQGGEQEPARTPRRVSSSSMSDECTPTGSSLLDRITEAVLRDTSLDEWAMKSIRSFNTEDFESMSVTSPISTR